MPATNKKPTSKTGKGHGSPSKGSHDHSHIPLISVINLFNQSPLTMKFPGNFILLFNFFNQKMVWTWCRNGTFSFCIFYCLISWHNNNNNWWSYTHAGGQGTFGHPENPPAHWVWEGLSGVFRLWFRLIWLALICTFLLFILLFLLILTWYVNVVYAYVHVGCMMRNRNSTPNLGCSAGTVSEDQSKFSTTSTSLSLSLARSLSVSLSFTLVSLIHSLPLSHTLSVSLSLPLSVSLS